MTAIAVMEAGAIQLDSLAIAIGSAAARAAGFDLPLVKPADLEKLEELLATGE